MTAEDVVEGREEHARLETDEEERDDDLIPGMGGREVKETQSIVDGETEEEEPAREVGPYIDRLVGPPK